MMPSADLAFRVDPGSAALPEQKECDFEQVSKDTMADRRVFKLEAVPKRDAAESDFLSTPTQVTFWADAETWNVLGWELKTSDGKCACARSPWNTAYSSQRTSSNSILQLVPGNWTFRR